MSDRNQEILRKLVKEGAVDKTKLEQTFNMTSRQLSYSIDALNQQLSDHALPDIQLKHGRYYSDPAAAKLFTHRQDLASVIFSPTERQCVLLTMLLTSDDAIFLDTIAIDLQISKNTALSDIKRLKQALVKDDLAVQFGRKEGYRIYGDEWTKRTKLMQAIATIYRQYGEAVTTELLDRWQTYLAMTKKKLQSVEQYLGVKYTDEDFYSLIYFISAILVRIKHGQVINSAGFDDRDDIEQTREYQALFYNQDAFSDLPVQEKAYIALNLLSANTRDRSEINERLSARLSNALWEFLTEFEAKAFIVLPNKKELLVKLIDHFTPAYYRIKYHIPVNNVLYDKITSKYEVLHNFVRQAVGQLERFFKTTIADEEIAYITLFIGGHLVDNQRSGMSEKTIKAVILCPNGVSISRILAKSLKKAFPEFLFYPPSAIRDYPGFLLPHDLVFSTVPVASQHPVYVVNDILNKSDLVKLRQTVLRDVFKVNFEDISADDIVTIVKRYATIPDEDKLKNALNGLLLNRQQPEQPLETGSKQGLLSQLNENVIAVRDSGSWQDALAQAVELLMKQGVVDKNYRDALFREYRDQPAYIILNQNIVLPHLNPDVILQKLGVSLVIIRQGVTYASRRIHIVALLATPDKVSHLDMLYDINRLAQDDGLIQKLAGLTQPEEVWQALTLFFNDK